MIWTWKEYQKKDSDWFTRCHCYTPTEKKEKESSYQNRFRLDTNNFFQSISTGKGS